MSREEVKRLVKVAQRSEEVGREARKSSVEADSAATQLAEKSGENARVYLENPTPADANESRDA